MENKKLKVGNVPPLRFPGFEGAYMTYSFKDIFLFSTGKNIKQNEASPEFEIPCVRYGELYHLYNEVISEVINKTNLDKSELIFSKGDEILLPSAGEDPLDIGSASALTIEDVAIGRTINILRPMNANVYSHTYVSYYINQKLKKKISTLAKGVSISNVYNSDLSTLEIVLPSIPEQIKITSFLSLIDERIQTQNKIIEELKLLKNTLSKKIFTGQLKFKDELGNNFPNWEMKKLGEIGNFQTSSIDKLSREDEKKVFLVNYMNVYRHENINKKAIKSFQTVTAKDIQIESCNLKRGDILFTPSSETPDDIGHSVVIFEDLEDTVFSYHLMRFRPKTQLDILYSHYFCNVPSVLNQLSKLATGSTRFTISVKSFSKIEVSLPCKEEQSKIANFLSTIDLKIRTEIKIAQKLERQKTYFLANLFI